MSGKPQQARSDEGVRYERRRPPSADGARLLVAYLVGTLGTMGAVPGLIWVFTGAEWAWLTFGTVYSTMGFVAGSVGLLRPHRSLGSRRWNIVILLAAVSMLLVTWLWGAPARPTL